MISLVISDIHNRVDWIEPFLSSQVYDEVIFLGDYFDEFDDSPQDAKKTAIWLHSSLEKANRIHLLGNHDVSYGFPRVLKCPGWDENKDRVVKQILNKSHWAKLRPFYFTQKWLLSHAGVHPYIFCHPREGFTLERLQRICDEAISCAMVGHPHMALGWGRGRGGYQFIGGMTWLDWEQEFTPIEGLNQIVGHSQQEKYEKKALSRVQIFV